MKMTINKAQVKAKIDGAKGKMLYALTSEIATDCQKYVKVDKTPLRSSMKTSFDNGVGVISWDTPYAKRQYWEIKTALTPGTSWKWCHVAKLKHKSTWQRQAQRRFIENL